MTTPANTRPQRSTRRNHRRQQAPELPPADSLYVARQRSWRAAYRAERLAQHLESIGKHAEAQVAREVSQIAGQVHDGLPIPPEGWEPPAGWTLP